MRRRPDDLLLVGSVRRIPRACLLASASSVPSCQSTIHQIDETGRGSVNGSRASVLAFQHFEAQFKLSDGVRRRPLFPRPPPLAPRTARPSRGASESGSKRRDADEDARCDGQPSRFCELLGTCQSSSRRRHSVGFDGYDSACIARVSAKRGKRKAVSGKSRTLCSASCLDGLGSTLYWPLFYTMIS